MVNVCTLPMSVKTTFGGGERFGRKPEKQSQLKALFFVPAQLLLTSVKKKKLKKLKFSMKSLTLFFTIQQYTFHSTFDLNLIKFYKNAAYILKKSTPRCVIPEWSQ